MMRLFNILGVILIVAAGVGLYQLKHNTRQLQNEVERLERQIVDDAEAIRVLRAEWAFLTRPERIEALGERYLALHAPESHQVIRSIREIGLRDDPAAVVAQVDDFRMATPVLARGPAARPERPAAPVSATAVAEAPAPAAPEKSVQSAAHVGTQPEDDPLAFLRRLRFVAASAEGQHE